MVEIRIHGRGGQGGVTLAKLIATTRFLTGHSVQAFGLYAAERSGAPIQAFCRFSPEPITDRNLIYEPDHVIILDPTLVGPAVTKGLRPGGWILVNTDEPPDAVAAKFPHNRVAVVDATAIALDNRLGTRSVPIVNTALSGAVARILGVPLQEVLDGMEHLGFGGGNVTAARTAHEAVQIRSGRPSNRKPPPSPPGPDRWNEGRPSWRVPAGTCRASGREAGRRPNRSGNNTSRPATTSVRRETTSRDSCTPWPTTRWMPPWRSSSARPPSHRCAAGYARLRACSSATGPSSTAR